MMSASLVIGRPVALHPEIAVAVDMKAMTVMVVVASAVVMAVVVVVVVEVVVTVAVKIVAVIIDREILVRQPRKRRCVLSMTRPTPRASNVDGTVATVPKREVATSYPE